MPWCGSWSGTPSAAGPTATAAKPAILDALRAAGALTVALVAEEGGEILGQVAFSPVAIDGTARDWYGLGPVAVRPDRQGQGIGQALIRAGLDRIRALGAQGCVLAGAPGYYGRFGFVADPRLQSPGIPPNTSWCCPSAPRCRKGP